MNLLINKIIKELSVKHGLPTSDIERIVDSEFKCLENNIRARGKQSVNMIYIGKFKPSSYFLANYDKLHKYKTKEEYEAYVKDLINRRRLDKLNTKKQSTIESEENGNMQDMSINE